MMQIVNHILFARAGGLGDLIVALPLIMRLRQTYPLAKFTLLGRQDYGALVTEPGVLFDDFQRIDAPHFLSLFTQSDHSSSSLTEWLNQFDLIYSCLPDDDGVITNNFKIYAPQAQVITVNGRLNHESAEHSSVQLAYGLNKLNLSTKDLPLPKISPTPQELEFVQDSYQLNIRDKFAAFHYGSGSAKKNWPLNQWLTVTEILCSEYQLRPIIFLGEVEMERRIKEQAQSRLLNLHPLFIEGQSLRNVAALLKLNPCYAGNDSGISHLAAAVGTPSVVLFGPTNPNVWKPLGKELTLVHHCPLSGLPTQMVLEELERLL